jgi:hypothetical protein
MTLDEVDDKVEEYLISDRQWTRLLRIAYAEQQIKGRAYLNHNDPQKVFWKEILKRLS